MNDYFQCKHDCSSCGEVFYAPEIGGDAYGRFLLYSQDQEYCLVNCIGAENVEIVQQFQEISKLLSHYSLQLGLVDQHDLVRSCVGVTCDPSDRGHSFHYDRNAIEGRECFYCGSNQTVTHIMERLPDRIKVPNASFHQWSAITEDQKKELLTTHADKKIASWKKLL